MDPLSEIALRYPTDKSPAWANGTGHNYTPWYHDVFGSRRMDVRRVLEIGINEGNSLRMWRDYFPHAEIWGLDIHYPGLFTEERIKTFYLDQSSVRNLKHFHQHAPVFDIIIDDGSHEPSDQILTAQTLLDLLTPDGTYVIEDIRQGEEMNILNAIPGSVHVRVSDRKADDQIIVIRRPR